MILSTVSPRCHFAFLEGDFWPLSFRGAILSGWGLMTPPPWGGGGLVAWDMGAAW